jgi:hypothetical protein
MIRTNQGIIPPGESGLIHPPGDDRSGLPARSRFRPAILDLHVSLCRSSIPQNVINPIEFATRDIGLNFNPRGDNEHH